MVVLPQTFQQAGWVLPVLALFGVAGLSCVCGIMLIEAMTLVPGNNRFQKRLEYTNIAHIYFPRWLYWVAQIFYQLSILAQNISMIIQSVQVRPLPLPLPPGFLARASTRPPVPLASLVWLQALLSWPSCDCFRPSISRFSHILFFCFLSLPVSLLLSLESCLFR